MSRLLLSATLGFLVGFTGTLCGGALILLWRRPTAQKQAWLVGISGGIMLAVVAFDLWPEAWQQGGAVFTAIGCALGVALIWLFDILLPSLPVRTMSKPARTGLLIGLGIGTHNFPEGVALGTAFAASTAVSGWIGLALLMGLHNIPEGTIMATTLKLGRVRLRKILLALALVELPMSAGAAVGGFFGRLSAPAVSTALAFAGGAMFFVVVKELIPAGRELGGRRAVWLGTVIGSGLGLLLTRAL